MPKLSKKISLKKGFQQKGVALILMAVILALAASAYAIKVFNVSSIQARQETDASTILANAKATLLGYTFGRVGAGERPGNMPYPDYFASTEVPANYDGFADDGCMDSTKADGLPLISIGSNMSCLGRLPWQTIGMTLPNPSQNDALGIMPWYAVSANLVDTNCFTALNPGILNATACSGGAPLHPWLTVRDNKGNIISNRVAIVLILPKQAIGNQARPSLPLGDVRNYLDTAVVPAGCSAPCVPGTYSNADLDNDFIMASGLASVNIDQNNQNLAITINDKVLFITIDEFMAELTKRAAGEARKLLNSYKANNQGSLNTTHFPYAAPLGAALNNNNSNGTSTKGSLPIDITDTCSCTSGASCTCNFQAISNVAFKKSSGAPWTSKTLACTYAGPICTCTGAGSCKSGARSFNCGANGLCTHNVAGASTYAVPNHADIVSVANGCVLLNSVSVVCNAVGSFKIGLKEPTWFKTNLWQDYFYYHQSSTPILQVGHKPSDPGYQQGEIYHTGIYALIIGTGSILVRQTRPSSFVADYLDSPENTNGDSVYDAIGTVRNVNYNDQSFIVAP